MTFLRHLLAFALLAGWAGAAPAAGAIAAHHSFMDVYRFAVSAELAPGQQLPAAPPSQFPEYQVRVASMGAHAPAAPVFSVAAPVVSVAAPGFAPAGFAFSSTAVPAPSRWLLILSGLALAAWVARRRLGYSL